MRRDRTAHGITTSHQFAARIITAMPRGWQADEPAFRKQTTGETTAQHVPGILELLSQGRSGPVYLCLMTSAEHVAMKARRNNDKTARQVQQQ